jgi:hypothetical protein
LSSSRLNAHRAWPFCGAAQASRFGCRGAIEDIVLCVLNTGRALSPAFREAAKRVIWLLKTPKWGYRAISGVRRPILVSVSAVKRGVGRIQQGLGLFFMPGLEFLFRQEYQNARNISRRQDRFGFLLGTPRAVERFPDHMKRLAGWSESV